MEDPAPAARHQDCVSEVRQNGDGDSVQSVSQASRAKQTIRVSAEGRLRHEARSAATSTAASLRTTSNNSSNCKVGTSMEQRPGKRSGAGSGGSGDGEHSARFPVAELDTGERYARLERQFLEGVRRARVAEDANEMGRGTNIGSDSLQPESQAAVYEAWTAAEDRYDGIRRCATETVGYEGAASGSGRVWRSRDDICQPPSTVSFDEQQNYAVWWRRRYVAKRRFVVAARKVILRLRASRMCSMIFEYVAEHGTDAEPESRRYGEAQVDEFIAMLDARAHSEGPCRHIKAITAPAASASRAPQAASQLAYLEASAADRCTLPSIWNKVTGGRGELPSTKSLPGFVIAWPHEDVGALEQDVALFAGFDQMPPEPEHVPIFTRKDEGVEAAAGGYATSGGAAAERGDKTTEERQPVAEFSLPESLQMPARLPSLHTFDPTETRGRYARPMPFSEVDTAYHVGHPVNRLHTSVTDNLDRMLRFQHTSISNLSKGSDQAPLSAVLQPRMSARFHGSVFAQPPVEQTALSEADVSLQARSGERDFRRASLVSQVESMFLLPPCRLERDDASELLLLEAGAAHRVPPEARRLDVERALLKRRTADVDALGRASRKRLHDYVDIVPPGSLLRSYLDGQCSAAAAPC